MDLLGRRYDTGQPVRIEIADGRIAQVTAWPCDDQTVRWPWIAPGWIDLQVNGHGGREFTSPDLTVQQVDEVVRAMVAFGVARFCPTLTTERFEILRHAAATIAAACEQSPEAARRIVGIDLEGPYLSTDDGPRGAHPRQYCRPPRWDEFSQLQVASGGRIRLLTMAVEFEGAARFVQRCAASGVVVAIGHTAANAAQIRAAVDAGAKLSTHLGNGCHGILPRHPNYIWDQLAEDRLTASLIVDGHHLPPAVVKAFVRAKTPARCILVSDLSSMAGLPLGRHKGSLCEADVLPGGRIALAGQPNMLAGAGLPIGVGVANVIRFAGVSPLEAVQMAVHNPARLLGIKPGGLEPGDPGDLALVKADD